MLFFQAFSILTLSFSPSVFRPFVSVFSLSMIPLLVFVDMTTVSLHSRGLVQPVYSQNTFGGGVNSLSLTNRRLSMFLMARNLSRGKREHLWCLSWYLGANTPNVWGERGSNPPCKKNEICKSGFRSIWDLDFPSLKARGVGFLGVAGHVCAPGALGTEAGWGGCGSFRERHL